MVVVVVMMMGFEVVGGADSDADTEDAATESLTFNPKDWASLIKSAAGEGHASGRGDGDNDGDGGDDGETATRHARVFGREAKTFDECGLPTSLVKHLTENVGFGAPTKVQAMTDSETFSRERRAGARGDGFG
jgi:hypothetical protein